MKKFKNIMKRGATLFLTLAIICTSTGFDQLTAIAADVELAEALTEAPATESSTQPATEESAEASSNQENADATDATASTESSDEESDDESPDADSNSEQLTGTITTDFAAEENDEQQSVDTTEEAEGQDTVSGSSVEETQVTVSGASIAAEVFTVRFIGLSDVVISEVQIEKGQTVEAPVAPEVEGYLFTGWDADLSQIQGNIDVHALYTVVKETHPEFHDSVTVGEVIITAYAEKGIIPAGARLSASLVALTAAQENKIDEVSDLSGETVKYAYDINIVAENGDYIQPENREAVSITFSNVTALDEVTESAPAEVVFVEDNATDADVMASVEESSSEISFEAPHFSVYVYVAESVDTNVRKETINVFNAYSISKKDNTKFDKLDKGSGKAGINGELTFKLEGSSFIARPSEANMYILNENRSKPSEYQKIAYFYKNGSIPNPNTISRDGFAIINSIIRTETLTTTANNGKDKNNGNNTLTVKYTINYEGGSEEVSGFDRIIWLYSPVQDDVNTAEYTVNHYLMNANGTYNTVPTETVKHTGTIGATVTAPLKTYAGYITPASQTLKVTADGNASINYQYARNQYQLTLYSGVGISDVIGTGSYYEGQTITISATVKAGYDFTNWSGGQTSTSNPYVFTMPDHSISLTAAAKARNVNYTVEHYYMLVDGSYGTPADVTDTFTGDVDSVVTAPLKDKTGFTSPTPENVTITADGNAKVTYRYSRNKYAVKLEKGTGIESVSGAGNYFVGQNVTINAATITNYNFKNWTGNFTSAYASYSFTMPDHEVNMTANAAEQGDVKYTIIHKLQALDGNYSIVITEEKYGKPGNIVPVQPNDYTGFKSPSSTTVTITADGNASATLQYARNKYNLTLTAGQSINTTTGAGNYFYEQKVTISATAASGYTFANWSGTFNTTTNQYEVTMPAGDVTMQANAEAQTVTYKVEHYLMGLDGNYSNTPDESYEYYAKTGTMPTAPLKAFTGFKTPTAISPEISGDGKTVVKYYYERNSYSLTLNKANGIASVGSASNTYFYGQPVSITATPEAGYDFSSWGGTFNTTTNEYSFVMPNEAVVLTAYAAAAQDVAYTVKHHLMGLDGLYGESIDVKHYGTTGSSVEAPRNDYEGFAKPEAINVTIKGDGTSTVDYYYARNKYNLTINQGTGIAAVAGSGEYYFGQTVAISATAASGYNFSNWSGTFNSTSSTDSITMPAGTVTLTANATVQTTGGEGGTTPGTPTPGTPTTVTILPTPNPLIATLPPSLINIDEAPVALTAAPAAVASVQEAAPVEELEGTVIDEEPTPLAPTESEEELTDIEEEDVPLAVPTHGDCWIHWLILILTALYTVYELVRGFARKKKINELSEQSKQDLNQTDAI